MKVLGLNGQSVIVEMTGGEWHAIGGRTETHYGITTIKVIPDIKEMAEALRKIQASHPDLEYIRATFKTFLMLTEPETVQSVLASCGVAEPIVEDVVEIKEGDSVD